MDDMGALVLIIAAFLLGMIAGVLVADYYMRKAIKALMKCTIPRMKKLREEVKK